MAKVSNAPELLRGLGYWFFYGDDKLGPWIEPSVAYTQHLWLIGAGYLLGDRRAARGGSGAVEGTRVLRRPARDRHADRGGLTSLRRSVAVRLAVRPLHPPRPRARPALDASSRAADHPCARCRCWAPESERSRGGVHSSASSPRRQRSPSPSSTCPRSSQARWSRTTCSVPRSCPSTGVRTPPISTPRATTPGCSSSPAPTSRRTGGATRSTRSCRG